MNRPEQIHFLGSVEEVVPLSSQQHEMQYHCKCFLCIICMQRESTWTDSFPGLCWGGCSTFITATWNGIPLQVLSMYCRKVWSRICSHSLKKAIFPWAQAFWFVVTRSQISWGVLDFTCTEAMQVHSAWRENAIWLLNFKIQFGFILFFIEKVCAGGVASFFVTGDFASLSMLYKGLA
jgi:hypothetical protein